MMVWHPAFGARGPLIAFTLAASLAACGPSAPVGKPAADPAGKAPAAPQAEVDLLRGTEPRELVRIGTLSVLLGPAPGPLERKFFADPRQSDVAWYLLHTYAPFEMKAPAGDLAFHGQGRVKAGETERRMILEWTRKVAADAAGNGGGEDFGLALAWHQGSSSLECQDVEIYLAGEAVARSCGWDGEVRGRLEPGALARVYDWFDSLRPFQAGGGQTAESLRPGALETRLVFAGQGARPPKESEQEAVQSFAAAVYSELAARRNGAAPPPPPPAPNAPGAKPTPAAAPEPPPSHLLLPPAAFHPRPEEVVLQLPEKPPPVPPSSPRPSSPGPSRPPAPGEEGAPPPHPASQ